jgi:hypothetical protein
MTSVDEDEYIQETEAVLPQYISVFTEGSWWPGEVIRRRTNGLYIVKFMDGTDMNFDPSSYQVTEFEPIIVVVGEIYEYYYFEEGPETDPPGWYVIKVISQIPQSVGWYIIEYQCDMSTQKVLFSPKIRLRKCVQQKRKRDTPQNTTNKKKPKHDSGDEDEAPASAPPTETPATTRSWFSLSKFWSD